MGRVCNKDCWVASSPSSDRVGDRPSRSSRDRRKDLLYREASSRSQIQNTPGVTIQQFFKRQNVSPGEICNVDVVTDGGTIRRVIVIAIDLELRQDALNRH